MAPATTTQRLEQLEESITDLENSISERIATAIEQAILVMCQSLSKQLVDGQSEASKRVGEE